jgi:hypothetical protein
VARDNRGRQPPLPGRTTRRTLLLLSIVVSLLVIALMVTAGIYTFATLRTARAEIIDPSKVPADVFVCTGFHASQSWVYDNGGSHRHYQLIGECPDNPLALTETYISELEYRGWTVHTDGGGNLNAYNYTATQALTINMADSQNVPNQSALTLDVYTGQDRPPDFPAVPSPSPSA